MRKKKLILHIGTSKTGTTTIQHILGKNPEQLADQGYLYPASLIGTASNHTKLAAFAMNDNKIQDIRIAVGIKTHRDVNPFRKSTFQALEKEFARSEAHTVILSNEHCSSRLITVEEIECLKGFLDTFFDEIKIVIYLREQLAFLVSTYSTGIKVGGKYLFPSVKKFLERKHRYDYDYLLGMWESVFGLENIIVRIYDRDRWKNGDIFDDFCDTIGISVDNETAVTRNKSLNLKQLEFVRRLNQRIPRLQEKTFNKHRVGLIPLIQKLEIESPPIEAVLTEEYFGPYFEKSNKKVQDRYFPNDDGDLFRKKVFRETPIDQTKILDTDDIFSIFTSIYEQKAETIVAHKKRIHELKDHLSKISNSMPDGE